MSGSPRTMNRQIRLVGIGMIVLFVGLFVQLNYIQVFRANGLNHNPLNTRLVIEQFNTARGDILSSDGVTLAQSLPTPNGNFKYLRQYPQGATFAGITGYYSYTYGSDGAEREFSDYLTGAKRPFRLPKSAKDLLIGQVKTEDVTLTVSARLQQLAAQQLAGRAGAVVALVPATGAVLAMYANPTFDPNPLAAQNQQTVLHAWQAITSIPGSPLSPAAYRQRFFPGSTFKIITAAAVLDHMPSLASRIYPELSGLVLPQTNNQILSNFGGEVCGGNMGDLFRLSCNSGFGQIGLDLGAGNLASEAYSFGFDRTPPLDLPNATEPYFPPVAAFSHDLPSLAKSAIGQENVAATPLEMALSAAGIANGGVVMAPHILDHVTDSEGQVDNTYHVHPWITATSGSTAGQMTKYMISVVRDGTGVVAQIPGIQVAAKTGTAQTGNGTIHSWFAAFAPAAQPKIAVAVIVENQPGNATGASVAGPIAKALLQSALSTS